MWTGPQIEAESPSQTAWDALEAKNGSTRKGENRSGGHGGGERGKPRRRGSATNTIPTLQVEDLYWRICLSINKIFTIKYKLAYILYIRGVHLSVEPSYSRACPFNSQNICNAI
jgi:hypothetical protein